MPPNYVLLQWGLNALWCLLVFCYGAVIGSFINVIAYRLPQGLSVISPPSRCPKCQTRLSWRDNIPVLGWIFLRGKCRYCRAPISPEYPIVEAFVGGLFVLFFALWYLVPTHGATFAGIDWSSVRPVWYLNPAMKTWPSFLVLLILLASMVAMTIVDARTFTIPLSLTTVPAVAAFVIHPIHAAAVGLLRYREGAVPGGALGWLWVSPTPGGIRWDWIFAGLLGMVGLGIGALLVQYRLIRRSFEDYPAWEDSVMAQQAAAANATSAATNPGEPIAESLQALEPHLAPPASESATPVAAESAVAPTPTAKALDPAAAPVDLWVRYPHARREMFKEMAFLAPCAVLMLTGLYLGRWLGGMVYRADIGIWTLTPGSPLDRAAPLWLCVLAGVCLGLLIGGGIVWIVRILGTLGLGKEAMGLGDVHLMAAVGACLGWIDSGLAFIGASFVGLFWIILSAAFSGRLSRTMPYGPYLAVSTVLVVLFKPLIKLGLSRLTGVPIQIP